MEKVKIQDLEKGKIYKAIRENVELDGIFRINNANKLMIKDDTRWVQIEVSYNTVLDIEFIEIEKEIDWTKVPRGTKVQVRDSENQEWSNAYFSKILKSKNTDYPFRASFINDDEFTKLNLDDTSWSYKCCRIHKSVEIPEEWYKEVE